jgi:hypothetical protein
MMGEKLEINVKSHNKKQVASKQQTATNTSECWLQEGGSGQS